MAVRASREVVFEAPPEAILDALADIDSVPTWSSVHKLFADKFAGKTRDEWTEIFAGTDACVTPVLTWREAAQNEHLRARSTLVTSNDVDQAAPAPRFSRTPSGPVRQPPQSTTPIDEIDW